MAMLIVQPRERRALKPFSRSPQPDTHDASRDKLLVIADTIMVSKLAATGKPAISGAFLAHLTVAYA
jgi:hypothetical protein